MPSTSSDPREAKKVESNWVTVLKNYQLMRNSHFETDAQNWHIVGSELVIQLLTSLALSYPIPIVQ